MRLANSSIPLILIFVLAAQLSGCAGPRAFTSGQRLQAQGDYDAAVTKYMEAVDRSPDRADYIIRLSEAITQAGWYHLERGRALMQEHRAGEAVAEFRRALEYDKTLEVARTEMLRAEEALKVEKLVAQADEFMRSRRLPQARSSLDQALLIDPQNALALELLAKVRETPKTIIDGVELDITSTKPISLKFKETDIKDAFNILSKLSGVNFILDESLKKQSFTFELTDVSFPQALELIMQMNKLGKKVLNPRTIVIYSRSKEGDKQFSDQLIQTFYLSNIDAKKAVNLLRTMLQLRRVYVHEELNAIIVRDVPEVIKLAGQILEAADRADAEVTFDLELIEVNHGDTMKLGPNLSPAQISLGMGKEGVTTTTGTTPSNFTIVNSTLSAGASADGLVSGISGFKNLKSFYSLPILTFDFLKTRSDSEILASPKIRVKNREKAKVMVGSKEPVITVTNNGTTFTDSVTYVDVGVKLDIEPTIQLDNSVVAKVSLEVSNVAGISETKSGTKVITLATTNAQSVLTLKDGERTIIGGLVRDNTSKSNNGIVLLSDLPLIGPLFTNHDNNKSKREILLSITPHIVQNIIMPQATVGTIWSGAEEDLKAGPLFGAFTTYEPEATPVSESVPVSAPPLLKESVAPPVTTPPVPPATEPEVQTPPPAAEKRPELPAEKTMTEAPSTPLVELPVFEPPAPGDGRLVLVGPAKAAIGQEVQVSVQGKGMNGLFSAPLFLEYNPEFFDLVKITEGGLLKANNAPTVFTTTTIPGKGEVIVGYKQGIGGAGVSGDGVLFTVTLRTKSAGKGTIKVDRLNLRNAAGNRLKVEATPLDMEIH